MRRLLLRLSCRVLGLDHSHVGVVDVLGSRALLGSVMRGLAVEAAALLLGREVDVLLGLRGLLGNAFLGKIESVSWGATRASVAVVAVFSPSALVEHAPAGAGKIGLLFQGEERPGVTAPTVALVPLVESASGRLSGRLLGRSGRLSGHIMKTLPSFLPP